MTTEESAQRKRESICDFLENATVLLTGVRGTLGKVLVEKLLRSCKVAKIYVFADREGFDAVFDSPLFEVLKKSEPDFKSKIRRVVCDVSDMDLSKEDRGRLVEEVEVMFQCDDLVKMDEPLKKAMKVNVVGARRLIELARDMRQLKSFVFTSSAFSNRKELNEVFYEPRLDADKLTALMDILDDDLTEKCLPRLLNDFPNTHTFTKNVAEDVIRKETSGLPVCLVRHSFVSPICQEPLPGWTDTSYGPMAVFHAVEKGLVRTLHCSSKCYADMVPADYLANCLIAVTAETHSRKTNEGAAFSVRIYNCTARPDAPLTWGQYFNHCQDASATYPSSTSLWYPYVILWKYATSHRICSVLLHWLPAILIDMVLLISQRSPRMMRAYLDLSAHAEQVEFFATHKWRFWNCNVQKLWDRMDGDERRTFVFRMERFKWREYLADCVKGGREHVLGEKTATLSAAKRKRLLLATLHYLVVGFVAYLVYKFYLK